jgi:hypothetical protein
MLQRQFLCYRVCFCLPGRATYGLFFIYAIKHSPAGDVVGKISVGYQGWFACIGDGAPINAWWHWSNNWSQPPSPSNNNIKAWPDMTEYTRSYQTAYANLNGGGPGHPVLVLRPVHGQHPLPVDAAERL